MRCLIVDDSPPFRAAARAMLERGGFTVVADASTCADAIRAARDLRPEVALVDIDLGGQNGFDVAEQLHRMPGDAPLVILISTHAEQDFQDLIESSSAVGFLPKFVLSAEAVTRMIDLHGRSADGSPFS